MVNSVSSIDDIGDVTRQARQGSVAAIIQLLNEQLSTLGVRVRAVLDNGMLQILCEAASCDQLEQSNLVYQIRKSLESISPRKIRRIKINARIVREQQLLWLEEIKKDPQNQLLWSQVIILRQPALLQLWWADWRNQVAKSARQDFSKALPRSDRHRYRFWQGIAGGIGLSALLVLGGWIAYDRFATVHDNQVQATSIPAPDNQAASQPSSPSGVGQPSQPKQDAFAQAIRLAETAAQNGQSAKSSADWLQLAAQWQQAAELMTQVPTQDQRYKKAQEQADFYRRNSQVALQKAQMLRPAQ